MSRARLRYGVLAALIAGAFLLPHPATAQQADWPNPCELLTAAEAASVIGELREPPERKNTGFLLHTDKATLVRGVECRYLSARPSDDLAHLVGLQLALFPATAYERARAEHHAVAAATRPLANSALAGDSAALLPPGGRPYFVWVTVTDWYATESAEPWTGAAERAAARLKVPTPAVRPDPQAASSEPVSTMSTR